MERTRMKTKRSVGSGLLAAAVACAAIAATPGCELIVDFDRSKIPVSDASLPIPDGQGPDDGSTPDANPGGNPDAGPDATGADATTDGAPPGDDGGDASPGEDAADSAAPDAGPDAALDAAPDGAPDLDAASDDGG
jgi:hypothetical protein